MENTPGSPQEPPPEKPPGSPAEPAPESSQPTPMPPAQTALPPGSQQHKTNGFSIASLVLGILSVWPLAVIFGHISLSQIKKSGGTQGGQGMAIAGLVLGYFWLAISVIYLLAR